ncbi:MAG TPA: RNase adapter RapZ [Polyangiaceae bacterium]|nr:RNase adapter RapZ [Polyangiaceae bacterium]
MTRERLVIIVSGLSGAGKSTALHALEDLGFFCIDNLPVPVMAETLAACEAGGVRRIAVGIDVRVRTFLDRAGAVIDSVRIPGEREVEVLFLDATDETLLRRFSSTRRPHPLSHALGPESSRGAIAVLDGVRLERERLSPLRARAKQVVDTTELSVHDLRRRVVEIFGPGEGGPSRMVTRVVSFGFKYGMPVDADLVLDVRFLPNPFFVGTLRPQSGLDESVRDYVLGTEDAQEFVGRAEALLEFCLPRYEREGKSYLTIAVGCTGGRHRSVTIAARLAADLGPKTGLEIGVVHRDIDRDVASKTGESFVGVLKGDAKPR